eukprot:PhF_6_TR8831/c0_g1_i1/m.14006
MSEGIYFDEERERMKLEELFLDERETCMKESYPSFIPLEHLLRRKWYMERQIHNVKMKISDEHLLCAKAQERVMKAQSGEDTKGGSANTVRDNSVAEEAVIKELYEAFVNTRDMTTMLVQVAQDDDSTVNQLKKQVASLKVQVMAKMEHSKKTSA